MATYTPLLNLYKPALTDTLGNSRTGFNTNSDTLDNATIGSLGILTLAHGGTAKALTASNGGIVYTDADSFEILSGTATAQKLLMSQANVAPIWSTPTYPNIATLGKLHRGDGTNVVESTFTIPDTMAINTVLYASAANILSALATANSGIFVTGATGIPSIATDIPTAITIGAKYIYRADGTDVPVADGGTGLSTVASGSVLVANALNTISALTWAGAGTKMLVNTSGVISMETVTGTGAPVLATSPTLVTPIFSGDTVITSGGSTSLWIKTTGVAGVYPLFAFVNSSNVIVAQCISTLAGRLIFDYSKALGGYFSIRDEINTGADVFKINADGVTIPTMTVAGFVKNAVTTGLLSGGNSLVVADIPVMTSAEFATKISDETGTGQVVLANTPTLVTPVLGIATGTSIDLGGTTLYGSRVITVDTGGVLNIDIGSASGDDFTVDVDKFVVEGDTGNIGMGTVTPSTRLDAQKSISVLGVAPDYSLGVAVFINTYNNTDVNPTVAYPVVSFQRAGVAGVIWASTMQIGISRWVASGSSARTQADFMLGHGAGYGDVTVMSMRSNGNVGIGTTTPLAALHIKAGTATASTAPLKLTTGINLTTAELGAIEFTDPNLYFTVTDTTVKRKGVVLNDGANLTSGKIPVATTNGRLVDSAGISATIPIAPVAPLTVAGSATFTNGILTAYTPPS